MAARDLSLETLQLEQDGRVLTARFSNPPHNFVTTVFIRDLDQLTRRVDQDPTVGAVVLTGGVEGCFLTHADPLELGGMQDFPHPQLPMRVVEFFVPVLNTVLRLPGLAKTLERFGGAPGKGIVMGYRWKRTILRMNRSSVECAPLTAVETLQHGLVHRLVPEEQLLGETQATAARLARRSPAAVAALKRCLYFGLDRRFSRALDLEIAGFLAAGSTRAAARALRPFLEDMERLDDTPFLADPQLWIEGTRFDQVG